MPGRGRDEAPFLAEINALYREHRGWKQRAGTGPDAVDDLFVARLLEGVGIARGPLVDPPAGLHAQTAFGEQCAGGRGELARHRMLDARLAAALVRPADPGNAGPCAPGFGLDGCARTVKKRPWPFPTIRAPF